MATGEADEGGCDGVAEEEVENKQDPREGANWWVRRSGYLLAKANPQSEAVFSLGLF